MLSGWLGHLLGRLDSRVLKAAPLEWPVLNMFHLHRIGGRLEFSDL